MHTYIYIYIYIYDDGFYVIFSLTKQGFDLNLGVNFVAPYLLLDRVTSMTRGRSATGKKSKEFDLDVNENEGIRVIYTGKSSCTHLSPQDIFI